MSKSPYPYQLQQDFIDQYLEIPREHRPPFPEWVEEAILEKVPFIESNLPTITSKIPGYWEWLQPRIQKLRFDNARRKNRVAAERRRRWHRKASTLRA